MMSRGELNTRYRDFAEVWTLSRSQQIDASALRSARVEVASHRRHSLVPLASTSRAPPGILAGALGMLA